MLQQQFEPDAMREPFDMSDLPKRHMCKLEDSHR